MDTQHQVALDNFLADIKTFQDSPITAEFPYLNKLELSAMNPAVFETDHKSRYDNAERNAYGSLLRRIRSSIDLLFDEGHDPIEEAVDYIREKAGIEFTSMHHPKRNQAHLKLNNGFQLMHFWQPAFVNPIGDNGSSNKRMPVKVDVSEPSQRVRNYIVVNEFDLEEFTKEVNLLIQEGWQPLGGMCASPYVYMDRGETIHDTRFVQAMVKY